jgi:Zn-dependent M16 (insulinase) family peptidase
VWSQLPNDTVRVLDFRQEGFRYDFDDAHKANPSIENVGIHGIVYNEMKGAMSDPNAVVQQDLESALYPTTTYRHNSGGLKFE